MNTGVSVRQSGHWYAATARPQMDVRAAKDMLVRGITSIVAVDYEKTRIGKKWSVQPVLWLSPYVFVLVETSADFETVLGTLGIEGFVSLGRNGDGDKCPTCVRSEWIADLMEDQVSNLDQALRRARSKDTAYRDGDRVRVFTGAFAGRNGRVKRVAHGKLWLEEIGPFPVRVDEADVYLLADSARAA